MIYTHRENGQKRGGRGTHSPSDFLRPATPVISWNRNNPNENNWYGRRTSRMKTFISMHPSVTAPGMGLGDALVERDVADPLASHGKGRISGGPISQRSPSGKRGRSRLRERTGRGSELGNARVVVREESCRESVPRCSSGGRIRLAVRQGNRCGRIPRRRRHVEAAIRSRRGGRIAISVAR